MFSCNVHDKSSDNAENVTLKQTVQGKFDEKLWASPIEKDRLNQDISSIQSVSKNISLTPAIINSSSFAKNLPPVYPYLDGFSLVDENSVSESVREVALNFCRSLSSSEKLDGYFISSSIYELSLFLLDLKNLWIQSFDEPFPEKNNQVSENAENLSEENNLEEKKLPALFTEFIFGHGEESDIQAELPVRLITEKKNYIDVLLYFCIFNETWKINQIEILNAGGKNEF